MAFGAAWFITEYSPKQNFFTKNLALIITVVSVVWLLANYWMPLGAGISLLWNFIFVAAIVSVILGAFYLLEKYYVKILNWCLANKVKFLMIPTIVILFGTTVWVGFNSMFGFVATGFDKVGVNIRTTSVWSGLISFPSRSWKRIYAFIGRRKLPFNAHFYASCRSRAK